MHKGLRLMAMCTGIFAPSIEFLPYLEQFLDELVVNNQSNDIGITTRFFFLSILPEKLAPSLCEL
jgi:hypothetical protein